MAEIISQEEDQPTDRWVDTLSGLSDPRELVPRNCSDKYLRVLKLPLSTTILHKLQKAFPMLCPVTMLRLSPRALNKQKIVNKERTLLSDESNNERCSKRVTGHGQAHAMPITRSLMQTCRVCLQCIKQPKNTRREREREKGQRADAKRPRGWGRGVPKNNRSPSCLWRGEKQKLEDREKSISKEQKKCKEDLEMAGRDCMLRWSRRLQKVIKDRTMGAEITVVQGLVEVVTSN